MRNLNTYSDTEIAGQVSSINLKIAWIVECVDRCVTADEIELRNALQAEQCKRGYARTNGN